MTKMTNITGIGLPLAVWLASDDYDFSPDHRSISATSLLKPVRQILLRERLTKETQETPDITDFIAPRLGTSIHDGIEKAWVKHYQSSMRKMGHPQHVIDRIRINPTPEELKKSNEILPVYLEQRGSKDFKDYSISGKFDMVIDGELHDFKTTSVYTMIKGSSDQNYCLQGSLYRWIHQDKITSDYITINFVFTDWQRSMARSQDNYPDQRVAEHRVKLMSLDETETWIRDRIRILEAHADKPEAELPLCSDSDLWRSPPVWKFFSNPAKTDGRCTRRFDTKTEAYAHQAQAGKGVVIEEKGKVKACSYCPAFTICSQKDLYEHD